MSTPIAFSTDGKLSMVGLSTETKPAPRAGDCFMEIDTGNVFYGDGAQWICKSYETFDTRYQPMGGGSDPWTYVRLSSDFSTSSATAVDVTGLAFTPAASTFYEFEGFLRLRTATATVNPRAGLAWPTGMTDGVAMILVAQAATGAPLFASGNINAALLTAVGGLPNTTQSWPANVKGTLDAGASPLGSVRVQLASETAGTNVTAKAGSFLRYRSFT